MKTTVTLVGATAVGFLGVIALHGNTVKPASSLASSNSPTTSSSSNTSAASSPTTTAAGGSSSGPTTTSTTTPSVASASGTVVGKLENYGYGQISVKVTVANNKITDVTVNSIQALEAYSMQIEQQVVPILRSEVLKAQSARISGITGATYTCEAYAYSLQNALTQLHFK